MWVIEIPIALHSANDRVVNGRDPVARAKYRERRKAWLLALLAHRGNGPGKVPVADGRRVVHITRFIGPRQRQWDHDNLVAACKGLRDSMQRSTAKRNGAGIIVDDSIKWSRFMYFQKRETGKYGVRILFQDVRSPFGDALFRDDESGINLP